MAAITMGGMTGIIMRGVTGVTIIITIGAMTHATTVTTIAVTGGVTGTDITMTVMPTYGARIESVIPIDDGRSGWMVRILKNGARLQRPGPTVSNMSSIECYISKIRKGPGGIETKQS
jgi:hypothetical protein